MYNEFTTISELMSKGWISTKTMRILSDANIQNVGQIGYGNPYGHAWLAVPGLTWDAYEDIMDSFARMDLANAENDPEKRALFFDRLPQDLQYRLDANFECGTQEEALDFLSALGSTTEKWHNAAISGPYALMRLNRKFDLRQNTNLRATVLKYLDDDVYADTNDIYAQVRERYAIRRATLKSYGPVLSWDEINQFHLEGALKARLLKLYVEFLDDWPRPINPEIQLSLKTVITLFEKPDSAYPRLLNHPLTPEELYDWTSLVGDFKFEADDILRKVIQEAEEAYYNEPAD